MGADNIAATLGDLEVRHRLLLAELARLETAIAVLEALRSPRLPLEQPDTRPPEPRAAEPRAQSIERPRPARSTPAPAPVPFDGADVNLAALRTMLLDGPLPVNELIRKSKVSRYYVQLYLKRGLLVGSGTTSSRRVSLPGRQPAKEEP